jgi:hypothetical protein
MQYTNVGDTWLEWSEDNASQDDATKLAALREIITETARSFVYSGNINAAWANKKLAKLGITDRIDTTNAYTVEVPVSGTARFSLSGRTRAEALEAFARRMANAPVTVAQSVATAAPVFTDGPEDASTVQDPDAPVTVQATLDMLREIVMLGNVSGPRYNCDSGANRVLTSYGLAPLPERKTFTVRRPAAADMVTVVEAYDEATALRVADWRWEDGQKGYKATNVDPIDDLAIVPAAS